MTQDQPGDGTYRPSPGPAHRRFKIMTDADRGPGARLVDEWLALRAEIAAAERAEHPDITDRFGRVWVWKQGSLYVHDQFAWTVSMIRTGSLPSEVLRDNPNYRLCGICTRDWSQP